MENKYSAKHATQVVMGDIFYGCTGWSRGNVGFGKLKRAFLD